MDLVYTVSKIQSESNYPNKQGEGFPVYDLQDHFICPESCKAVKKNTLQGHRPWAQLSELWGICVKLRTEACGVPLKQAMPFHQLYLYCQAWSSTILVMLIRVCWKLLFQYRDNSGHIVIFCSNSLYKTFVLISSFLIFFKNDVFSPIRTFLYFLKEVLVLVIIWYAWYLDI